MPPFRRGCFAKYVLLTFFVLFVYTFLAGTWIPREDVETNLVNGNPDSAHKMLALAQFNGKDIPLIDDNDIPDINLPHSINHSLQIAAEPITTLQPTTALLTTLKPTQRPTKSSTHRSTQRTTQRLTQRPTLRTTQRTTQRLTQRPTLRTTQRTILRTTKRPVQHPTQSLTKRPLTKSSTSNSVKSKSVNVTTPFPLGEDNTWNFTIANNSHPFKFLKNASDVCTSRRIFLLNIIHSKPSNFKHRNIIRKTWGNKTTSKKLNSATVFVLGKTNDLKTEAAVDAENQKYHDIVQEDFLDSYRNLTYKAVAVLRWITTFCANAEFVLKTDDDVFVNIFDVSRLIRRQLLKEPNATKFMCQLSNRNVLREKKYKWYVSEKEYPYKRYPPYCMGVAFIMPGSVIPLLYNASFTTKFFWIDDVYSTGMLAHVANVSHVNIVKKFVYKASEHRDRLVFGDAAIAHVAGGSADEKKEKYWKEIQKIELNET